MKEYKSNVWLLEYLVCMNNVLYQSQTLIK